MEIEDPRDGDAVITGIMDLLEDVGLDIPGIGRATCPLDNHT